jgi:hypothetical protein
MDFLKIEIVRWGKMIRQSNVKVDSLPSGHMNKRQTRFRIEGNGVCAGNITDAARRGGVSR